MFLLALQSEAVTSILEIWCIRPFLLQQLSPSAHTATIGHLRANRCGSQLNYATKATFLCCLEVNLNWTLSSSSSWLAGNPVLII